jgi:ABC-type Fe3+-siderophore transport system permease subunit
VRGAPAGFRSRSEDRAIASTFDSRRLSYTALMAAAGLAGVYAETIPNFEVLTLTTFCAGVLLGVRDGALVGAVTMLLYTLLNPYGPAHPLVMAAQVAGTATAGIACGVFARAGGPGWPAGSQLVALGLLGAVLTAWFDLLTNLATGVLYGQMRATLIGGMLFATWHIVTNLVLFTAVGGALVRVLSHYRARLSPQRSS